MKWKSPEAQAGPFSPPMELLLKLLQSRVTSVAPDLRLKSAFIDTLAIAGAHGVLPAVADGLRKLTDPGWTDLLPFLQDAACDTAKANNGYVNSARQVSAQLSRASVPHVFVKGLAFFFDDPSSLSWRTVSDIDLHVKEADLPRAATVIQSLGYRQSRPGETYVPRLHHHAAPLLDDSTGVFYELHSRMMQAPRHNPFTFEEILAASRVIQIDGLAVRIPSPEHRMYNLIAHAQISDWGFAMREISIRSLLDAVEITKRHAVDWQAVADDFKRISCLPELMGFLVAGHCMLGLSTGLENEADARAWRWADEAIEALRTPPPRARRLLRILGQYSRMIRQDPRRLEMVWHTLVSPGRMIQLATRVRGLVFLDKQ